VKLLEQQVEEFQAELTRISFALLSTKLHIIRAQSEISGQCIALRKDVAELVGEARKKNGVIIKILELMLTQISSPAE
jgi:hypothetical protein